MAAKLLQAGPFEGRCFGPPLAAARTAARKRSSPSGRSSISPIDSLAFTGSASAEALFVFDAGAFMVDDPDDVSISPHLIFLTGCVVTWWGRVEWLLTSDIQTLLGKAQLKGKKEFEVVQISSKRRITQWVRAHKFVYSGRPEIIEEASKIATEAREILEDRNVLIHGMWHVFGHASPDKIKVTHMEPPKGDKTMVKTYEITEAMVDEISGRAYDLYHRLIQLRMNLTLSFGGQIKWSIKGTD